MTKGNVSLTTLILLLSFTIGCSSEPPKPIDATTPKALNPPLLQTTLQQDPKNDCKPFTGQISDEHGELVWTSEVHRDKRLDQELWVYRQTVSNADKDRRCYINWA